MGCCDAEKENIEQQTTVRSCTDVFWLLLYVVFWFFMVLIAAFSFVYGNPVRIINGYDSFGNTCGSKNKPIGNLELSGQDTTNKPFLLFYDVHELKTSLKVCVEECPRKKLEKLDDIYQYNKNTRVELCKYNFQYEDIKNNTVKHKESILSGSLGPCPSLPIYESISVLNRCVPKFVNDVSEVVLSNFYDLLNNWDTLEQILGDLYITWREILCLTFLALVISLATICILHILAHIVSYVIMILVSVASVAGTSFLWYTYIEIKYDLNNKMENDKDKILLESIRNGTAFFWYSIIATIITVILLILIIFMRKKVDFLAELFKDTSKCLLSIPALFLQPLITFVILLGFFAFWVFVILCLATSYYPGVNGIPTKFMPGPNVSTSELATETSIPRDIPAETSKLTIIEYIDPIWVKYMWWVYFVGLIWTSEFIMGCQSMVIAGSVAHWFYRHKYRDNSHVLYAISKLIKYHLGSVALGSLLITIVKIPRLILMYLHEKLKRNKDKGSECASCGLKCCICCFYCLENFLRYLNQNAYTVVAIDGANFCAAAKTAFEVLVSHALEVATINSIGDFILFLGKCLVTAVTGMVGLYFFRQNPKLNFFAAPTLIVCIFAFFVAHCILSLYETVLDTVYLCKCESGDNVGEGLQMQNLEGVTNGTQNQELQSR
ncbi:choline transporter-like 1 [Onthophagus taurus]|uniref:choline transporter-like 1 n=1 Tax=Onthophagus taurus TaxID=166361 RepID=UPI0039BE821F